MINIKITIFYHRNISEGVKDEIRSSYNSIQQDIVHFH